MERRLGRFQAIANAPGLPRALANVFLELRLSRLAAGALADEAPEKGTLMQAYEAELLSTGLTDWAGVLEVATASLRSSGPHVHRLAGLSTLLLDVPIASRAEQVFLGAFAISPPEVLITAAASDEASLHQIRDELDPPFENLDELPSQGKKVVTAGALGRLQRHLFNDLQHVREHPEDDQVQIFSAPGESRECVEIARRILSLAEAAVSFDRIAVLLRSPESYRSCLDEAFARAGIPVHFARGAFRPDPAGRAFHALLRCAAEGLSAGRFAEYLSLGQVPDTSGDGRPPQARSSGDRWVTPDQEYVPRSLDHSSEDFAGKESPTNGDATSKGSNPAASATAGQLKAPRHWERLLVEAAVIGGRDRWRRRILGLEKELTQRASELRDEDEAGATSLHRALQDLDAFSRFALPLIDVLDSLPAEAMWAEWLDNLSALATRALRQPDRVLAVLSELAPLETVGPVTLSEILHTLEKLLLEITVAPLPQRYGRVLVGPIGAARGLSFEAVFVPGLAEKMFPRKIDEDPLLLTPYGSD